MTVAAINGYDSPAGLNSTFSVIDIPSPLATGSSGVPKPKSVQSPAVAAPNDFPEVDQGTVLGMILNVRRVSLVEAHNLDLVQRTVKPDEFERSPDYAERLTNGPHRAPTLPSNRRSQKAWK